MTETTHIPASELSKLSRALPFWMSLALVPLIWVSAFYGGWTLLIVPVATWYLFSALDAALGLETSNADPQSAESDLFWYKLITQIWTPVQFAMMLGLLWYVPQAEHLGTGERIGVFFGVGVITGTVGINYSHELMHQRNKVERWMADVLLAMVLYSHFRSEHLLVHHRYVATPRDPVSARYNEGFHRYYPRVLWQSWRSAFGAEKAMLARRERRWTDASNPFWRYWTLQAGFFITAFILGGWPAVGLFIVQAGVAIWQLELVNYIEHYGLTRKHLGDGKYEHVQPHHSWNAAQKASNWLLINLQRHSDHHYKPDRRFAVLQNYASDKAPQLPFGYPLMTMLAMVPPLWRRVMNPRVRAWRQAHYPEITDWQPYNSADTPMPR